VQPDVRVEEGLDPRRDGARLERLRAMTAELEDDGADVVVWPEAAYPHELDRDARADRRGEGSVLGGPVRGPLIFGAMTARGPCQRWNSLLAMDAKGRIVDRADKIALFPFAEFIPLWRVLPFLRAAYPCEGLVAGRDEPILEIAGARIGVLNCYEDVTDRYALALARRDPEVLVGSASDAWYGDTAQPLLHRRVASFRAIELRRDLVRALNTGESSFTSATGEDLAAIPVFERGSFVADARRLRGATVYATLGDWVSALAAATLLALAVRRARRGAPW
jgi:apolipoprotein N-acyltransferase